MRNPIVNQIQYRKPMKNPSYMKLMFSSLDEQTIEQVIACDAILATGLKDDKRARKQIGFRLAERMNYINHGESMIVDNVHPINKWLNNPHLKMMDRDTDYVPNCN